MGSRFLSARVALGGALVLLTGCGEAKKRESDRRPPRRDPVAKSADVAVSTTSGSMRCLKLKDGELPRCIGYDGNGWDQQRPSLEAKCTTLLDSTFGAGVCPELPAWGRCVWKLSDKSTVTEWVYRRLPRPQPGDFASEEEARSVACEPGAKWISGPAPSTEPAASAAIEAPPRARPTLSGICEPSGRLLPSAMRVARVDLHAYARWAAAIFDVNTVVAGEAGDPPNDSCRGDCLTLDVSAPTFSTALGAAGAPVTQRGSAFIVGPVLSAASPPPVRLTSRDVDLEFTRASAVDVANLLGEVDHREIRGMPQGAVTLRVKRQPAATLVGWMAEAAGTKASVDGSAIAVVAGGRWPASPRVERLERGGRVPDVPGGDHPFAEYRVAGVGMGPTRKAWALLARGGPESPSWIVNVGDAFGAPHEVTGGGVTRVRSTAIKSIDCDGVEGDDGTRLSLR